MAEPVLLAVATDVSPNVHNFLASSRRAGWTPQLLGVGERWAGFTTKIRHYAAACSALPPSQLVVCADTSDVLVRGAPSDAMRLWEEHFADASVVFGAEGLCSANCVPVPALHAARFGDDETTRPATPYINSGLIMGRAGRVAEMFQWMLDSGEKDDQIGAAKFVIAHGPEGFVLDHDRHLFIIVNYGTRPDANTTAAPFVHFPGMTVTTALWGRSQYSTLGRALLGGYYGPPRMSVGFTHKVLPVMLVLGLVVCVVAGAAAVGRGASAAVVCTACAGVLAAVVSMAIQRQNALDG